MPLPFNVGELSTRLRESLGIRGRIPLNADEGIISVAKVVDSTRVPYRLNEQRYSFGTNPIVVPSGATFRKLHFTPGMASNQGVPITILEDFRVVVSPASGNPVPTISWGHGSFAGTPTGHPGPRLVERWPLSATPDLDLACSVVITEHSGAAVAPFSTLGQATINTAVGGANEFWNRNAEIRLGPVPTTANAIVFYIQFQPNATIQLTYQVFGHIRLVVPQA